MAEYNLPSGSMNKIMRWVNQKRQSGISVQPWELEAAYKAEMDSLRSKQLQNRSITSNETIAANALAERQRQSGIDVSQREEDRKASEKAGMMSTIGNVGTTAGMLYAMSPSDPKNPGMIKSGYDWAKEALKKKIWGANEIAPSTSITPSTVSATPAVSTTPVPPSESASAAVNSIETPFLSEAPTAVPVAPVNSTVVPTIGKTAAEIAAEQAAASGVVNEGLPTVGPTAGSLTSDAASGLSSIATPLAVVGAVSGIRSAFGNPDAPYKDRTWAQQMISSPGTAGALLPLTIGKAIGGDSSDFGKAFDWAARAENKVVGEPLQDMFSGSFATGAKKLFTAPNELAKENFGETGGTVMDVVNPVGWIARQAGTCIIFGHYYGPGSIQARTAKRFCKMFMTIPKLIGYYQVGFAVIFLAKRSKLFKKIFETIWCKPAFNFMTLRTEEKPVRLWMKVYEKVFFGICVSAFHLVPTFFLPEGAEECIEMARKNMTQLRRGCHVS